MYKEYKFNDNKDNFKEIEIVQGNGSEIQFSVVENYIDIEKPKSMHNMQNIVIPQNKENPDNFSL